MAEATLNEYEMLYILHPRLTEDGIKQSVERVSGLITSNGGEVLTVDNWGRRRLAYPIDHELDGTYVLTTFKAPPTGTRPVEQQMQIAEDVLRHLLIRGIIPYEGPPEQIRERERERPPRLDGDAAEGGEAPAGEASADKAPADKAPAAEAPAAEAPAAEAPAAEGGEAPAAEAPAAEATDDAPEAASEEAPAAEAAPEAETPAAGDDPAAEAATEAATDDAPEANAASDGEEAPPTGGSG